MADIETARSGDTEAFRRIFGRHQSAVLAVAYSVVLDWALAEDICQEVFLRVFERLDKFQAQTNFKAWLLTIARNAAIDARRRRKPDGPLPDTVASTAPDAVSRRAFQDLLTPLDEEERFLLTLKYHEDFSYQELARVTGKAGGTLRNLVSAALRKLRRPAAGSGGAS